LRPNSIPQKSKFASRFDAAFRGIAEINCHIEAAPAPRMASLFLRLPSEHVNHYF
jgi:hypothetical protein